MAFSPPPALQNQFRVVTGVDNHALLGAVSYCIFGRGQHVLKSGTTSKSLNRNFSHMLQGGTTFMSSNRNFVKASRGGRRRPCGRPCVCLPHHTHTTWGRRGFGKWVDRGLISSRPRHRRRAGLGAGCACHIHQQRVSTSVLE